MYKDIVSTSVVLVVTAYVFWQLFIFGVAAMWCLRQKRRANNTPIVLTQKNNSAPDSHGAKMVISSFVEGVTRYAVLKTGKIPSFAIRNMMYRKVFKMNIRKDTIIYGGCEFRNPYDITIGKSVIGPNNILDGRAKIRIGDNVCTGSGVKIWTMQHDVQSPTFASVGGSVVIEDYAWVASFATILPEKVLGKGCVVSSNAVVTKNCEPYAVYAGIPAVKKGERTSNLQYQLNLHWGLY